jgi:hypothetical protein
MITTTIISSIKVNPRENAELIRRACTCSTMEVDDLIFIICAQSPLLKGVLNVNLTA